VYAEAHCPHLDGSNALMDAQSGILFNPESLAHSGKAHLQDYCAMIKKIKINYGINLLLTYFTLRNE
jgi:hypothetical protein